MTEPLTRNRVNIKAILADHLLREELIESATDFICKVEGIRRRKEDLEMTELLSPAAQAVLDAYHQEAIDYIEEWGSFKHKRGMAAALKAAANQVVPLSYEDLWTDGRMLQYEKRNPVREKFLAIAAELEGRND
jgi:hypothetical protein